ncbi:MAG TPA: response regulator [Verrucomicrobiae bacterium]|nr:response regulator [Verrucomicrobiae bacterium]
MTTVLLLIDDDEALPMLLEKRIESFDVLLRCTRDGDEGIDYLSRRGEYSDSQRFPSPSVVLLDVRMPRVNGFEVLEWMGQQSYLESLPVVVWSSSNLLEDRQKALALGAEDYVVKPMGLDAIVQLVRQIAATYRKPTAQLSNAFKSG